MKPQYTFHSTSRADYKTLGHNNPQVASYSRYDTSVCQVFKPNYNLRDFPGCTSSQTIPDMAEKISYEHQFNSRLDPSHPVRGRRHGCFVWKATSPIHKAHHGKYPNSKSTRVRKSEFEYSKNAEIEDNCDAKSVISTVTEKSQVEDHNKKSKIFEHKVKDNAWSLINSDNNDQASHTMQDDISTLDLTENEVENMIKPSRPRRHSPPPHIT